MKLGSPKVIDFKQEAGRLVEGGQSMAATSTLGRGMNHVGTNRVRAAVTSGSLRATASTSFSVSK